MHVFLNIEELSQGDRISCALYSYHIELVKFHELSRALAYA
jgi:hypothetical protein